MQAIRTSLTRLLDIRVPVVCAAMAGATSPQLAVEVTRSGGFGFVGAAFTTPEKLREELTLVRNSFPDLGQKPLPIGIGFIGWLLDAKPEEAKQLIDVVVECNVQALWLAFGDDLHRWIAHARTSSAGAGTSSSRNRPLVFVQVASVQEALLAANEWKVDVIIAQGNESGGHGGASAPSTFTLVSEILAALPAGDNTPPVLAAGGMANGTQIAAYLTLGAAGAVLGTRFLLTHESPYAASHKTALLAATSGSTVRTLALDYARGTYGWPQGVDGRGIRTKVVDDIDAGVPHETVQERHKKALQEGNPEYAVTWSGTGVGLMHEIKPAKDVMAELHTDIVQHLQRSQSLLKD